MRLDVVTWSSNVGGGGGLCYKGSGKAVIADILSYDLFRYKLEVNYEHHY